MFGFNASGPRTWKFVQKMVTRRLVEATPTAHYHDAEVEDAVAGAMLHLNDYWWDYYRARKDTSRPGRNFNAAVQFGYWRASEFYEQEMARWTPAHDTSLTRLDDDDGEVMRAAEEALEALAASEPDYRRQELLEEVRLSLRALVHRLPRRHREVLSALYFDGLGLRPAGARLGVHHSTVRRWEEPALRRLVDELEAERLLERLEGIGLVPMPGLRQGNATPAVSNRRVLPEGRRKAPESGAARRRPPTTTKRGGRRAPRNYLRPRGEAQETAG